MTPTEQLQAMGLTLADMEAENPGDPNRIRFQDVPDGPEIRRILALPYRPQPSQTSQETLDLAAFLTLGLSKSPDPYPGALRPIQALALQEAWSAGGLVAMMAVGTGKTLVSFLLPTVMRAQRPLYLCPAGMVGPVKAEFAKFMPHWKGTMHYPVLSYSKLAAPKAAEVHSAQGEIVRASLLDRIDPDLIVLDEAHSCGNSGSATAKRVRAFLKTHPGCVVVAMSGTLFRTSINQGAHLFDWALKELSPLPRDFEERTAWASCLDASATGAAGAGALRAFLEPGEEESPDTLRAAVGRRVAGTRGVLVTQGQIVDTRLTVEKWSSDDPDPALDEAFADLRSTWRLPDGTELADGIELARHAFTLGNGHYQIWQPPPPDEWREARNNWASWCRAAIKSNRRNIHSEATMKDAVRKGLYDDEGRLTAWERARDAERQRTGLREPKSVSMWVSDEAVQSTRRWLSEHEGVVWVQNIGMGEKLAEELKIPFYGAQGLDASGCHITRHKGGSAISSIQANGTGKNLQALWSKNLWLCTPSEQAIGRTHRPGQQAAVVSNWVYVGCLEHHSSFWRLVEKKTSFAERLNSSTQKLSVANITIESSLTEKTPRWEK